MRGFRRSSSAVAEPPQVRSFGVERRLRTGPVQARTEHTSPAAPTPLWTKLVPETISAAAGSLVVDPIPAGLWIHTARTTDPAPLLPHAREPFSVPRRNDSMTVVVGAPGDPVAPAELVTALRWLGPSARLWMRLAPYGQRQTKVALGQYVADALGERVETYTGLPGTNGRAPLHVEVFDVDGTTTWAPFAQLLVHHPGRPAPVLLECGAPVAELAEVGLGRYRLDDAVVVETVACGLWVHEASQSDDSGVRRRPCRPDRCEVVVGTPHEAPSRDLRSAANTLLTRLDPDTKAVARMRPAMLEPRFS